MPVIKRTYLIDGKKPMEIISEIPDELQDSPSFQQIVDDEFDGILKRTLKRFGYPEETKSQLMETA